MHQTPAYCFSFLFLLFFLSCPPQIKPQANASPSLTKKYSPVMRSLDRGASWEALGQGLAEDTEVCFIHQLAGELVLATEAHGLFLSTNNRSRWLQIGGGLPGKKISALQVAGDVIYVCVFRHGLFKSKDRGVTWVALNAVPEKRIQAILELDGELLIAANRGIFKSSNEQQQWTQVLDIRQAVSLNIYKNQLIAGTTSGVFLSKDKGENWGVIQAQNSVHNTAILNGKILAMYIINDLYCSEDWGEHWYKGEYAPSLGSYVYEAAQMGEMLIMSNNFGVHRSLDSGKTWTLDYKTEEHFFSDFLVMDEVLYGAMR